MTYACDRYLAKAHRLDVLAPTGEVWVLADGRHGIGKKVGDSDGSWQPFGPKAAKPEKPAKAEAPPRDDQMVESEVDIDGPISVTTRRFDQRLTFATASPAQHEALRTMLRVPVIVDEMLTDGVRVYARREARLLGVDLVVTEVRVGPNSLLPDIVAHTHTIASVEKYNGTRGKLRQLADQLKAWKKGEPTPRFAHGSRGWATELELGKLESLLAARRSPLHDGVVDEQTLREECDFLAGRVQFHREVLLSMEETDHGADSHLSLERPDVGQVTREAQASGYRLPGAEEGVQPDWYYYRNNANNAGQYDLVRKPTAPLDGPALRPRMVGDTHTGFEPGGRREPTPLPDDKTPTQALRDSPGFSEYAAMLEAHGIANATVLDRAVQTMHGIREMKASADRPITIEDLRRDVKDHFRDRVIARLIDPSLDATASWARMRSMVDNLSPSERGSLAEIWYRARHAPEAKAHVGIDVERSSGDNAGKMERRVIDAVQGRTAIEVKDTKAKIDQEQFAAYLDMLEKKTTGGPEIDKLKYVFTKPEGAIASLEFLAKAMSKEEMSGRISVEVFDSYGSKRIATTPEEAMKTLAILRVNQ